MGSLTGRMLVWFTGNEPGTVPVVLLVERELEFAALEVTAPNEDIGIVGASMGVALPMSHPFGCIAHQEPWGRV